MGLQINVARTDDPVAMQTELGPSKCFAGKGSYRLKRTRSVGSSASGHKSSKRTFDKTSFELASVRRRRQVYSGSFRLRVDDDGVK